MKTIIVENWNCVPFIGIQVHKFTNAEKAFEYAKNEYMPYGYNTAYYCKDTGTLHIGKVNA